MFYDPIHRCAVCRAPIAYAAFSHCASCAARALASARPHTPPDARPTEPLPVVWSDEEQRRLAFARYLVATGRLSEGERGVDP